MVGALARFLREHLDIEPAWSQGHPSPQQGVPNANGHAGQMPTVFSNFGPAPRQARQPGQASTDPANWMPSLPGSTDRLSHRMFDDLQQAMGPSPDGRRRHPATYARLPEILYRIRPEVLRGAIQCNAWTKQTALEWRAQDPGVSQSEVREGLGDNVFRFLRANARELSERDARLLAYHLADARCPEMFCDISARMHSPRASVAPQPLAQTRMAPPPLSVQNHAAVPPAVQEPAQQLGLPAVDASPIAQYTRLIDELTIQIAGRVGASGTLKEIRTRATTLVSQVDPQVLQHAVILEIISKRWGGKILNNLMKASDAALPATFDSMTKTLHAHGIGIKQEQIRDAVSALRRAIPRESLVVAQAEALKDNKAADRFIIDCYMYEANSKPFETTIVSGMLRRMPDPEQLLGANVP